MQRRALSLMELLLVLALIAGMGALSIPMLNQNFAGTNSLNSDAHLVADQLRRSRQIALDHAAPVCVQIAANGDQMVTFLQRSPDQHQSVVLSPGNRFCETNGRMSPTEQHSGHTHILFREDGSSTGGTLRLNGQLPSGQRSSNHKLAERYCEVLIRVERSTGQVTIEDLP